MIVLIDLAVYTHLEKKHIYVTDEYIFQQAV